MSNNEKSTTTSMSWFLPMLGLLFIALKLTGHIDWSWWLVTLPLWGGVVAVLAVLVLVAAIAGLAVFVSKS